MSESLLYQVRSTESAEAFTVCCNGTPILNADGGYVHLFPHEGDRDGRKEAYTAAKKIVDRLNKSAKKNASSTARFAQRANQSN